MLDACVRSADHPHATLCEDEEAAESSFYSSGASAWMVDPG